MKKLIFLFAGIVCFAAGLQALGPKEDKDEVLVIYAYDSFVSEWGLGPQVIPVFEEKYGIKVDLQSAGDAQQVAQKAYLEKDNPIADVLIGMDNNMLKDVLEMDILDAYSPLGIEKIDPALVLDPGMKIIPFDYGYFAIIYDSGKIANPPKSLDDLLKPEFKDSLIVMDPRTSSPGLGLFLWTIKSYGDDYLDYWKKLDNTLLTITEGWSSGYGLFTSGEAPMVLSYSTSPPYHVEYEGTDRYKAAVFDDGQYMQIEGAGIVKGCDMPEAARKFMDFVLSKDFQQHVALCNWMYPVNSEVELPKSFDAAPKPGVSLLLEEGEMPAPLEDCLSDWVSVVGS